MAAPSPAHPRSARVRRGTPAHPAYAWAATSAVRPDSAEPALLRCGDLVLDETRWTVHRAGTLVELSPTEFRLLACLIRHQGQVLTRTKLLQRVWGRDYGGQPQVLETYVSYLRRKLHRLGPPLIHTRRGIGYTLRAPDPQDGPERSADNSSR
jgi:two-component system OmpR family response regulator